jgi:hypothetical protein
MYQYSRAIYRSIKDLIDPWAEPEKQLEYRREFSPRARSVERLATICYFASRPDAFQDIRRYFPIT